MYSRKTAFSLAKQYRTCPPPRIREDPSQETAWENHRAVCPYCSLPDPERQSVWDTLAKRIERINPPVEKTDLGSRTPVRPGQLRFLRSDPGMWRGNYFYTPPLVLVMQSTSSLPGAVLAAQIYHDIHMAAPGDLIVTADDSTVGPFLVECWNTYTLEESFLGPPLDTVSERVLDAVPAYEDMPGFCPEWAMLPRPMMENDPRIFFRELELEVAYTFSSQSVSQLVEAYEMPYGSPSRLQEMIRSATPGTRWKRVPLTPEEAFALAALPAETLPLAAEDGTGRMTTANLVRLEAGRVKSITPVHMEIHGHSEALILSGRIRLLPGECSDSRLICFLEPEGEPPMSPVKYQWKEETGDFMVEFSWHRSIPWHLKAAVVCETASK